MTVRGGSGSTSAPTTCADCRHSQPFHGGKRINTLLKAAATVAADNTLADGGSDGGGQQALQACTVAVGVDDGPAPLELVVKR